jgi:hypothetical protein
MKILILSTHTKIHRWRLLPAYLNTINRCLPGVTIELQRIKLPDIKVVDKRIDTKWLQDFKTPYQKKGYDLIALHLSRSQWLKLGIESSLRGLNPRRATNLQDFYFWSDERTKRQGHYQFVQTFLHELLHEYFQKKGGVDLTHQWHDENPDITKRFPIRDIIDVL